MKSCMFCLSTHIFSSRQIKPALIQDQSCHFADDGSPFPFAQFLFSTGREMSVEVSAQGVDHGSRSHEFQSRNNPSSFFFPIESFFQNRRIRNCKDGTNAISFWDPDPLKLLQMVGSIFILVDLSQWKQPDLSPAMLETPVLNRTLKLSTEAGPELNERQFGNS